MDCKRLNNLGQDSDRAPLRLSPDDGHQQYLTKSATVTGVAA